jgi:hypothetical protein
MTYISKIEDFKTKIDGILDDSLNEQSFRRTTFFRNFNKLEDLDQRKAIAIVMHTNKTKAKTLNMTDPIIQDRLWKHYGYIDDVHKFVKDIAKDIKDLKLLPATDVSYGY